MCLSPILSPWLGDERQSTSQIVFGCLRDAAGGETAGRCGGRKALTLPMLLRKFTLKPKLFFKPLNTLKPVG